MHETWNNCNIAIAENYIGISENKVKGTRLLGANWKEKKNIQNVAPK